MSAVGGMCGVLGCAIMLGVLPRRGVASPEGFTIMSLSLTTAAVKGHMSAAADAAARADAYGVLSEQNVRRALDAIAAAPADAIVPMLSEIHAAADAAAPWAVLSVDRLAMPRITDRSAAANYQRGVQAALGNGAWHIGGKQRGRGIWGEYRALEAARKGGKGGTSGKGRVRAAADAAPAADVAAILSGGTAPAADAGKGASPAADAPVGKGTPVGGAVTAIAAAMAVIVDAHDADTLRTLARQFAAAADALAAGDLTVPAAAPAAA